MLIVKTVAKPKNHEMINAVHEVLAEDATLSYARIADALEHRGYPKPPRKTVISWVSQLIEWDLIDEDHVPRVPPLMPAYLFLDLPAPAEPRLRQALVSQTQPVELELLTGTLFNALLRTRVRHGSALEGLRRACLGAGARDARAALVLRRGALASR